MEYSSEEEKYTHDRADLEELCRFLFDAFKRRELPPPELLYPRRPNEPLHLHAVMYAIYTAFVDHVSQYATYRLQSSREFRQHVNDSIIPLIQRSLDTDHVVICSVHTEGVNIQYCLVRGREGYLGIRSKRVKVVKDIKRFLRLEGAFIDEHYIEILIFRAKPMNMKNYVRYHDSDDEDSLPPLAGLTLDSSSSEDEGSDKYEILR